MFIKQLIQLIQGILISMDFTQIHGKLYQGSAPSKGDVIKTEGFDVLVLCAEEIQNIKDYNVDYIIQAPGKDTFKDLYPEDLVKWKEAAKEAANHIRSGRRVLITCQAGLNRSGIVTAMTLRELTGWSGEKCAKHVKSKRYGALFNKAFYNYLVTLPQII